MTTPTIALIHSPLMSAAAWGDTPALLGNRGLQVLVPEVFDDVVAPYATRFVARVALQLAGSTHQHPLVLVGHGDAGALLPQIGSARRAAGHPVGGYVFVDASLPGTARTPTRLDLLRLQDPDFAKAVEQQLANRGRWPDWTESELTPTLPDVSDRALLLAGLRPRDEGYFTEALPLADDWPDARCGYLQLSRQYAVSAVTARHRGWGVDELPLHHLAMLSHPHEVADALLGLVEGL